MEVELYRCHCPRHDLDMVISEYVNGEFYEARNLALDLVCMWILPYALAKGLIQSHHLRAMFAKRIAVLLTIVSIVAELRIQDGV